MEYSIEKILKLQYSMFQTQWKAESNLKTATFKALRELSIP